jgi:hypothetical protein
LRILDALEHVGPMTTSDMQEHLGLKRDPGGSVLNRLTHRTKTMPKRVYIIDWRRSQDGQREYLRAVYALGDKPDKRKPPAKRRADVVRDYLQRCQAKASCVQPGINQVKARALVARMSQSSAASSSAVSLK